MNTLTSDDSRLLPNTATRLPWRGSTGLAVLLGLGCGGTVWLVGSILRDHSQRSMSAYVVAGLLFVAGAAVQWAVRPMDGLLSLRARWGLWVGFLVLQAAMMGLAYVDGTGLWKMPQALLSGCAAVGYALAYVVTINPPRASVWRRLWVVDAAIAMVVGTMIYLVFHHTETSNPILRMFFALMLQVFFAVGSYVSLRAATTPDARRLARSMMVYFSVNLAVGVFCNTAPLWPSPRLGMAGDMLFPLRALIVLALPLLFRTDAMEEQPKAHPFPPATTVLITTAILLGCFPLLRWGYVAGISLMVVAVALFAVQVALLQSDFEQERTSLLQDNRQLRQLAYTDPLTGVANRRRFDESLRTSLASARAGFGPAVLVLFRLERLPGFAETRGQQANDEYVRDFAAMVHEYMEPPAGHFARLGPEEFALLLEGSSRRAGETAVAHLRMTSHDSPLQFSVGLATATTAGPETVEAWVAKAESCRL